MPSAYELSVPRAMLNHFTVLGSWSGGRIQTKSSLALKPGHFSPTLHRRQGSEDPSSLRFLPAF